MTWYLRGAVSIAPLVLLAACGGRSQLRDVGATSAGGGGGGPTTSTGSTASASSGGEGGSGGQGQGGSLPAGCFVDGAPIGLAGTQGYALSNPVLLTPGASDLTTLVAGWTSTEGPKTPPSELRDTSFHAWGAWPASGTIGPSYLANYDGGQSFVAAPAGSGFSLFFAVPPPVGEITFMTPFSPGSGALAGMVSSLPLIADPQFLALGANPDIHLLGFTTAMGALQSFNMVHLSDMFGSEEFSFKLGCALEPIVADAAAAGESFLFAFTSGSAFASPACASGTGIGNVTSLIVGVVDPGGKADFTTVINVAPADGAVASVKLVPRADGAWLVWSRTQGQPLSVARLDPTGKIVSGTFSIPFFGDGASLSATALGDRLALAWSLAPTDAPSVVQVSVISSAGDIDSDVFFQPGPPPIGRTALLASPSGNGLLVAWSDVASTGPQIQLARIACPLP